MLADRDLLAIMSALIASVASRKETDAERVVDAAEELLDEVNERCNKRGKILPADDE